MIEGLRFKRLNEGESYECPVLVMEMEDKKTVSNVLFQLKITQLF